MILLFAFIFWGSGVIAQTFYCKVTEYGYQHGAAALGMTIKEQASDYQQEMAERLNLPFLILSDEAFEFCESLNLPTFTINQMRLIKRVTLIAVNGVIKHVHYPVFPSDSDAAWVLGKLSQV